MPLRVLTWNLFHGRAVPPRDADLLDAFAERLVVGVFARGWDAVAPAVTPERGALSDHAPVLSTLARV